MSASSPSEQQKVATEPISVDELIRGQLAGKLISLGRYDEILWKIRGGYVAALYGTLAFFVGKESKLTEIISAGVAIRSLFPIAVSLSACAFLIDLAFVLSKLRVVVARNRLSDLAFRRASGETFTTEELTEVGGLLHLSGEAFTLPTLPLLFGGIWPLIGLYVIAPVAIRLLVP